MVTYAISKGEREITCQNEWVDHAEQLMKSGLHVRKQIRTRHEQEFAAPSVRYAYVKNPIYDSLFC